MVQEFAPQLSRLSQIPLQWSNDSVGITILHYSEKFLFDCLYGAEC